MPVVFRKNQIVGSAELVRHFKKYMKEDEIGDHDIFIFKHNEPEAVLVDYQRYEEMKEQLGELNNLLEQVEIYIMVEKRKTSSTKQFSLETLKKKYGL